MSADALLAKLDGVKATGRGRWIARCPAHDDGRASLSVRERDDGRILLHDFAGCAVLDVVLAIGLDLSDLFPDRPIDHRVRRERDPFDARAVLHALAAEAQMTAIIGARIVYGHNVGWDEIDRMIQAVGRIAAAADVFRPHPATGKRAVLAREELEEVAHA